jgi:hypothetical protein
VRLDHVSYACAIDAFPSTVSRLGALLGRPFTDGGVHPRYGTRNAVLPLDGGKRRAALGGGWLGWVVSVDDLAPFEKRLGRPSAEGHRRRPDGVLLEWKQIGLLELIEDPQIPYLIEWCCPQTDHPSAGSDGAVGIDRLEISGERAAILEWLGTPEIDPLPHVHVNWLEPADVANAYDEAGLVAVDFHTAHGPVRID